MVRTGILTHEPHHVNADAARLMERQNTMEQTKFRFRYTGNEKGLSIKYIGHFILFSPYSSKSLLLKHLQIFLL